MEKKSERFEVRLGYQEKQDFNNACELQGDTPSNAIRRFISGYVKRSDDDVLSTVWRSAARRKLWPISAIIIGTAIGVTGIYWAVSTLSKPNADEVFAYRDTNKDGELDYSEHAIPPGRYGRPNGVLSVLDLDSSGTISRAEFVPEGRMIYMLSDVTKLPSHQRDEAKGTLVEFEIGKDRAVTGSYAGTSFDAKDLDRLVIWQDQGLPIVLEDEASISKRLKNRTH